jgi:hypothetical protein
MKRRLDVLRGFTARDLGVLGQAWILLLAVNLGLRLASLRQVQRVLAVGSGRTAGRLTGDPWMTIPRLQRLVGIAARHHLLPMSCLPRSLVLQALLARHGIEAELRFGVRMEDRGLQAHAWLEVEGGAIDSLAGPETEYEPLERLLTGDGWEAV